MDPLRAGKNGFQHLPHLGAGQQKLIGSGAVLLLNVKQGLLGTLKTRFGFCPVGFRPFACAGADDILGRVHVLLLKWLCLMARAGSF